MVTAVSILKSINGRTVKAPTDFGFEKYDLTKAERTASGKMVGDIIRKVRKFSIYYDVLSGPDLDNILEAIDTNEMFFDIEYIFNGREETATVYRGAIKCKKFRTDGKWYWKDVTFDLIEQ